MHYLIKMENFDSQRLEKEPLFSVEKTELERQIPSFLPPLNVFVKD